MATLLAITYPDPDRAKQAMSSVDWSHLDHQIRVRDACWIRNEDGELAVHPWHPVAGKAALGGGLGLLVGALFSVPVVGLAAGALIGIHRAKQKVSGLDDQFVTSIEAELESGGSAIIVLFDKGPSPPAQAPIWRDLAGRSTAPTSRPTNSPGSKRGLTRRPRERRCLTPPLRQSSSPPRAPLITGCRSHQREGEVKSTGLRILSIIP